MAKLFMITGLGSARDLASGRKGAFYNTLEEFHKHWDRIDIISPRIAASYKLQAISYFGNVFIHISPYPLIFHPWFFIKKALELHNLYKFDLMTVQEFPPFYNGIAARIIWQLTKIKYILEIHHVAGYPKAANFKEWIYRFLMGLFIRFDASKASGVRVVNKVQVPQFLTKHGIPEDKILYVPSVYIDHNIFKPQSSEKEFELIFVGRLDSNKGAGLFIKAVKILNVRGIILGDGPLGEKLRNLSRKLGANITFHNWAKDSVEVASLINKSKLLVMPSYNEGGPRVVVEAMACGIPVLATPVGIVPDLFDIQKPGSIIKWDASDIAQNAWKLLSDEQYYERCSNDALTVARGFDKQLAILSYSQALKNTI